MEETVALSANSHGNDESTKLSNAIKDFESLFEGELALIREINEVLPESVKVHGKRLTRSLKESYERLLPREKTEWDNFANALTHAPEDLTLPSMSEAVNKLILENALPMVFSSRMPKFIREMSLIYLLIRFEDFLEDIARAAMLSDPRCLMSEKNLTYKEILSFKTLDSLVVSLVDRVLDDVMREDVEDVNKEMRHFFDIDLSNNTDWSEFKERFYRRNIIVHNKGEVNADYTRRCNYTGSEKILTVDEDYLDASIKLIRKYANEYAEKLRRKYENQVATATRLP